jgi:hypothetical protein
MKEDLLHRIKPDCILQARSPTKQLKKQQQYMRRQHNVKYSSSAAINCHCVPQHTDTLVPHWHSLPALAFAAIHE